MNRLDKYIGELLYDHDCVIVPELGGFLTSYCPARIHPTRHTISPPSKRIAFNVFLKHNDGLLANYIVQAESLAYPEALHQIENFVESCNNELGAGRKFVIEQVGILTRDREANIQFEPFGNVNYLKDAFGLSPVHFIPVEQKEFDQQVEKQLRDFISIRPSQPYPRTSQTPRIVAGKKLRINSLNSLLLVGSVLWLALNLYLVAPGHLNVASLNPFSTNTGPVEMPAPPPANAATKGSEIYTQPVAEANSGFEKEIGALADQKHFYLIAGAFKNRDNALNKKAELKAGGFPEVQILTDDDSLMLVCYSGFSERKAALDELKRLKSRGLESWIFTR